MTAQLGLDQSSESEGTEPEGIELKDAVIKAYLEQHPDFFDQHEELLSTLKFNHSVKGAISLVERKITVLQGENVSLKAKLVSLVDIARENEESSKRLHHLMLAIIAAESLDDVMAATQDIIRHEFSTDYVVFRFLETEKELKKNCPSLCFSTDVIKAQRFKKMLEERVPVCGRHKPDQLEAIFGMDADEVKSAAILPLYKERCFGMLALGSRDEDRFNPAMGKHFLMQLADVIGAVLGSRLV
ncbi:MAG: DUF484 family protein [Gammaproteobacteria bacterium]|nr:DUF484 family protein [Gammaproteobacteria bacterium]